MPPVRSALALAALASLAATAAAGAAVDPPARPQTKLEKAATILVGNAAPFILRASVLNAENPIWMSTMCDQPYVGGVDPLSLSRPATDWVLAIQKKNGDGYNGTVALPLQFFAKCEINSAGKPECAFVFDSHPKLTGLATVAKAPAGVNLTGCTLYMDGSTATSSDCWNGANPLKSEVVTLASAAPEGAIIAINITVNAVDTATGTPFTVLYTHCQFAYNTYSNPLLFNPVNQAIVATDPRVLNWVPDVGEFGESGALRGKNLTTGAPVVQQNYMDKKNRTIGPGSQVPGRK